MKDPIMTHKNCDGQPAGFWDISEKTAKVSRLDGEERKWWRNLMSIMYRASDILYVLSSV